MNAIILYLFFYTWDKWNVLRSRILNSMNVMSLIGGGVHSKTLAIFLQVQSLYTIPSWMFPLSKKLKRILFNLELAGCTLFFFWNCMISLSIKSSSECWMKRSLSIVCQNSTYLCVLHLSFVLFLWRGKIQYFFILMI